MGILWSTADFRHQAALHERRETRSGSAPMTAWRVMCFRRNPIVSSDLPGAILDAKQNDAARSVCERHDGFQNAFRRRKIALEFQRLAFVPAEKREKIRNSAFYPEAARRAKLPSTIRRVGDGLRRPAYCATTSTGASSGCLCLHSALGHCSTGPDFSHFSTMYGLPHSGHFSCTGLPQVTKLQSGQRLQP